LSTYASISSGVLWPKVAWLRYSSACSRESGMPNSCIRKLFGTQMPPPEMPVVPPPVAAFSSTTADRPFAAARIAANWPEPLPSTTTSASLAHVTSCACATLGLPIPPPTTPALATAVPATAAVRRKFLRVIGFDADWLILRSFAYGDQELISPLNRSLQWRQFHCLPCRLLVQRSPLGRCRRTNLGTG